jgi:PAS domain S-box-containing protein
LDKIGQAVIARDMSGRIKYWNKAATEIYGWTKEEAIGEDIKHFIPTSKTIEEQEEVNKLLEKGLPSSKEFTVVSKSGKKFPVLMVDSPFMDEKGLITGVVSISSNISERKKNEKELKNYTKELIRANKGLEQFSFIVSHNLRAPLANLLGLADLLNQDFPQETKERLMQELHGNIKRLDMVVNDLNSILRVKSEVNENKEKINLQELVDSIVGSVDHTIKQEQVEILTDFSAQQEFTTVKSYLHSILYNLISNSIKYRKSNVRPIIRISSQIEADNLLICIEDNGLGMNLGNKTDDIFGLYKRYHTHMEGKGIGLFMVKTQVETLGGKITVESEQNKGSRFILKFKNTTAAEDNDKPTAVYIN